MRKRFEIENQQQMNNEQFQDDTNYNNIIEEKEGWPKYLGSIQVKASIQLTQNEIHQLSTYKKDNVNIKKGQQFEIQVCHIKKESQIKQTFNDLNRLHLLLNYKGIIFSVKHKYDEIWNILIYKKFIKILAFSLENYEILLFKNIQLVNIRIDVYLQKEILIEQFSLNDQNNGLLYTRKQGSKQKSFDKNKKNIDEQYQQQKQNYYHWELQFQKIAQSAIIILFEMLQLKINIPSLIQPKQKRAGFEKIYQYANYHYIELYLDRMQQTKLYIRNVQDFINYYNINDDNLNNIEFDFELDQILQSNNEKLKAYYIKQQSEKITQEKMQKEIILSNLQQLHKEFNKQNQNVNLNDSNLKDFYKNNIYQQKQIKEDIKKLDTKQNQFSELVQQQIHQKEQASQLALQDQNNLQKELEELKNQRTQHSLFIQQINWENYSEDNLQKLIHKLDDFNIQIEICQNKLNDLKEKQGIINPNKLQGNNVVNQNKMKQENQQLYLIVQNDESDENDSDYSYYSQQYNLQNNPFLPTQMILQITNQQNFSDAQLLQNEEDSSDESDSISNYEQYFEVINNDNNKLCLGNDQSENFIQFDTPQTMKTKLKPYQQQALSWMLYREQVINEDQLYIQKKESERKLNAQWAEIQLLNGQVIYYNQLTGNIKLEFQYANFTQGGILADEMGLGKTLMGLALIHHTKNLENQIKNQIETQNQQHQRQENDSNYEHQNEDQQQQINLRKQYMQSSQLYQNQQQNQEKLFDVAGTLIVVPKSLLNQWQQEIDYHSLEKLHCLQYYSQKSRKQDLAQYDIVITTYNILGKEFDKYQQINIQIDLAQNSQNNNLNSNATQFDIVQEVNSNILIQNNNDDSDFISQGNQDEDNSDDNEQKMKKILKRKNSKQQYNSSQINECKLFNYHWKRVILDEGHNIKNRNTMQARGAFHLFAKSRWVFTGTPIQNCFDDLFSLLHFLNVETFGDYYFWNSYINKNTSQEDSIALLKEVIGNILLRRTKKSTYSNGQSILQLPQKHQNIIKIKMAVQEKQVYDSLQLKSEDFFKDILKKNQIGIKYNHIFAVMSYLRQLCDSPLLIFNQTSDFLNINVNENLQKKLEQFFRNNRQHKQQNNNDNLIMDDRIHNQNNRPAISEKYRQELIENIKQGLYNTCDVCYEEIQEHCLSKCGHILCKTCFYKIVQSNKPCPNCRVELNIKTDLMVINVDQYQNQEKKELTEQNNQQKYRSSKLIQIINKVNEIKEKGEKCVVYTQWIKMINLIEDECKQNKIKYSRLDGSMSHQMRSKQLDNFIQYKEITVFLISLRAGSCGLNLTVANNIILVDPWWNPAIEDQAIERIYRIGQEKEVNVWRYIMEDSIEEKILNLHKKKKNMIDNCFIMKSAEEKKKERIEDLRYIFGNN